jgi:hypothetical protein
MREKAFPDGRTHLHAKEKKIIKSKPERTYLFMMVIKIDDLQYARTGKTGFLDIEDAGFKTPDGLVL